jgi:hypothetical protein
MLSQTIGPQGFQTIARRNTKVAQHPRLVEKPQLSKGDILDVCR